MNTVSQLEKLFRDIESNRFYGTVELKFESGRLVLIKKTESIKPVGGQGSIDNHYRNSRENSNGIHS